MKKLTTWFLSRGLMVACLWAGIVHGVPGAKNLGLAIVWFAIVMSILAFLAQDPIAADLAKTPRSPIRRISIAVDLAVAGFLIWHGYTVAGVLTFLSIGLVGVVIDKADKLRTAQMKEATAQ